MASSGRDSEAEFEPGIEALGPQATGIHLRLRSCRAAGNSRGQQVGIDGEINLAAGAEHVAEIENCISQREAEMLGHGVAFDETRFGGARQRNFGTGETVGCTGPCRTSWRTHLWGPTWGTFGRS